MLAQCGDALCQAEQGLAAASSRARASGAGCSQPWRQPGLGSWLLCPSAGSSELLTTSALPGCPVRHRALSPSQQFQIWCLGSSSSPSTLGWCSVPSPAGGMTSHMGIQQMRTGCFPEMGPCKLKGCVQCEGAFSFQITPGKVSTSFTAQVEGPRPPLLLPRTQLPRKRLSIS